MNAAGGLRWVTLVVAAASLVGCAHVGSSEKAYSDGNRGVGEKGYFEGEYAAKTETGKAVKTSAPVKTGYTKTSVAYPTGRVNTSTMNLEKIVPNVVRIGSSYDYKINVTNLTDLELKSVTVSETVPQGFTLEKAVPEASAKSGNALTWNLGNFLPGQTRTITISGVAKSQADVPCCTSVDYDVPALCSTTGVIQPAVALDLEVPASMLVCNRIPVNFTVKNTGDSTLTGVVIQPNVPAGVRMEAGSLNVGTLAAGQSKTVTTYAQAQNLGAASFSGTATAAENVTASAAAKSVSVIKPVFAVTAASDKKEVYIGREVVFNFTAKNTGNASAENAVVDITMSPNVKVTSAANAQVSGRVVRWNVGTMAANASKSFAVTVVPLSAGTVDARIDVMGACSEAASASAKALALGIPALLLEVVDIADPVEVGGMETYRISVTNQGSADATNIKVEAMLEDMEYVSSTGATTAEASGSVITMKALPRLAAQDKATWDVKVRATKSGDLRFKVKMNSDQLGRDVEETESTFVY